MTTLTIERDGRLALPPDLQARSGLLPEISVRVVETQRGILLVPLTDAPMSAALIEELEEWQALGQNAWGTFPYEDEDE